ncbi:hypothetical protein DVH05_028504 [Phytophthora capsici]|nr:hypothetical protein DVH05_028504 [Phytophthora capsici]
MSKPGEETPPLEELEEKPRSPPMDADEVGSTLEVMENLGELPSLPFANDYDLGPKYYNRVCYDEYYTLVKDMLGNEEGCVTVTGTPGIGKSIFYAYFFQRLQKEKKGKNTWIIAAAYRKDKLKCAFVYKDSADDPELIVTGTTIDAYVIAAYKEKKRLILLSDGPPERLWGATQMVVFTSPNDSWLRSVRKDNCTLYMPLWTLAELQEAAEMLVLQGRDGSDITDEMIEERFYTFGGVARECFYRTEDLVKKKRNDLVEKIGEISSLKEVRTLLKAKKNEGVCHGILQFEAEHGERTATSLASPFVVEELGKRMLEIVGGKREEIIQSFQNIPEGAALAEWTFKVGVHETLGRGCKLQLRPLPSDVPTPGSQDTSTANTL